MKTSAETDNLEAIHVLRGIAAFLVVLCHARVFFDYLVPGLGNNFEGGYSGVDIFFLGSS